MKQKIFTFILALSLGVAGVAHAKSIGSSSSRSSSSSNSSPSSKPSSPSSNGSLGGKAVGYQRSDLPKPVTPTAPAAQPSMIGSNVGKPQQTHTTQTQSVQPTQSSGMSTGAKVATGVALGAIGGAVLANTMSGPSHQTQQQGYPQPQMQQQQAPAYQQHSTYPQTQQETVYQQAPSVQQTQPQVQVIEKTIIKEVPTQSSSGGSGFFWFILIVALLAVLVGYYYVSTRKSTKAKFDAFRKAGREFAGSVGDEASKDFKARQAHYNDTESQKPITPTQLGSGQVAQEKFSKPASQCDKANCILKEPARNGYVAMAVHCPGCNERVVHMVPNPNAAMGEKNISSTRKENTAVGGTPESGTVQTKTIAGYTDEGRFTTIQTAFAKGDKETLKQMLSTELYESLGIADLDTDESAKSTVSLDQMQFEKSEDDSVYSVLYNFTDREDPSNPVKRAEWWHYDLSSKALVGIQPVE